ncbi:MAG: helix-turn-helix transcriptional regulator [Oceanospirillaceae bacterium]|nr:helix-turn-helix transcriptional regulator [Oceanospirillaceae bacterium]
MYDPIPDGIAKTVQAVSYVEAKPPSFLAEFVHNYWELKTDHKLADDFYLHAVPDACVNILFNQLQTDIAGVTALRTSYEKLNLGVQFHYVGIQFFPGVWQGDPTETTDSYVGTPYLGKLPLIDTSRQLTALDFAAKQVILSTLVAQLIDLKLVAVNPLTAKILANIEAIQSVADMASTTQLSSRQLQRLLKQSTGFAPHDFLKVIRLQQSFKHHSLHAYTDQSHFIHSFRKITGYTPAQYYRKYDV